MTDDVSKLTKLGSNTTEYKYDNPTKDILECFPSPTDKSYTVTFETEEYTSLCPKTKQRDYGSITITYVPDKLCIESKSLKLYLFAYSNYQGFMESITNKVAEDLFAVCQPIYLTVKGDFAKRGGISIEVERTITKK